MRIDVVTIFPAYLQPLREALVGKAIERGLIELAVHDLRDWTHDVHRAVDDAPYGGGPGMVMRPQVWGAALDAVCRPPAARTDAATDATTDAANGAAATPRLVVPTPAGRPFTQRVAQEYSAMPWLVFACGRYEGIDQRVIDDAARRMPVDEVSIGDYVLVGGEAAVLVIVEAVARLLPGCWATRHRRSRTRTPTACSKVPPTPAPRCGASCRCRRCCAPAIMPPSPAGAATSRCAGPPSAAPNCSHRCRRSSSTSTTTPCSTCCGAPAAASRDRADFTGAGLVWHTGRVAVAGTSGFSCPQDGQRSARRWTRSEPQWILGAVKS